MTVICDSRRHVQKKIFFGNAIEYDISDVPCFGDCLSYVCSASEFTWMDSTNERLMGPGQLNGMLGLHHSLVW